MNCHNVRKYLSLYLDSELSSETTFEISHHLEDCPACQARLQKEEQLESAIRVMLQRSTSDDEKVWQRAVRSFSDKDIRQSSTTRLKIIWAASAVAVALVVLSTFMLFQSHPELDLAAAAAAEHEQYLSRGLSSLNDVASAPEQIRELIRKELGGNYPCSLQTSLASRIIGIRSCMLDDVKSVQLVVSGFESPVSIFCLKSQDLRHFPMAFARLEQEGPLIHCQVNSLSFQLLSIPSGAVCAVGIVELTELTQLFSQLGFSVSPYF